MGLLFLMTSFFFYILIQLIVFYSNFYVDGMIL